MKSKSCLLAPLGAALLALTVSPARAQTYLPEGAQVNMFFPHLANGGVGINQWQTQFIFVNPNASDATVHLDLFDDNGNPLPVDLGSGLKSTLDFTVPAGGSVVLRGTNIPTTFANGWAQAFSDVPLQGVCIFTWIKNGVPIQSVSAPATLPATDDWFAANAGTGLAFANIYNTPVHLQLKVTDANGNAVATEPVTVPANGHTSFNLGQQFPALAGFSGGSIHVLGTDGDFLALALNVDRGTVASLPPGRLQWPADQYDAIWLAYLRIWNAASQFTSLGAAPDISNTILYASGNSNNTVFATWTGGTLQINVATAELTSDSPSELAFVIGHEMALGLGLAGHGTFSSDPQIDADAWGMLLAITAGYDPYGAGGALGKINMALQAGTATSSFDMTTEFATRMAALNSSLVKVCSYDATATAACQDYLGFAHPDFPGTAPASVRHGKQTRL
ncbi:MAG TPA: hypothetical protein VFA04_28165, partial [Bryobacteraceae bacterium]|nr:hypothetical protein [Bryobacteraceae bacterium]